MTCYNSEMKSVKEVLQEMQDEKNKVKELKQKILAEMQKLENVTVDKNNNALSVFAKEITYNKKEVALGEYNLTFVSSGTDPLDSNTMEYVYKLDDGTHLMWSAPYSSYDNGGPDGSIDKYNVKYFEIVELKPVVVNVWKPVE